MRLFHTTPTKATPARIPPTFSKPPMPPKAPEAPKAPKVVLAPPTPPKVLKAAKAPAAPKEKPVYAKFRVYRPGLYTEFKIAATVRKLTLIKAFERAMQLFIAELTAEMDGQPPEAPKK